MCEQRAKMTSRISTTDYRLGWLCHLGVGLVVALALVIGRGCSLPKRAMVNLLLTALP